MCEISSSNSMPAIDDRNICIINNGEMLNTVIENDKVEGNCALKEVEEDMELLELKDSEVSDSILFKFKSKNLQSPVSSPPQVTKNRRYTLRPQKRPETTEYTSTDIRKRSRSLPKNGSLETIFENPMLKNGSLTLLGKSKLKRYLSFDSFVSKAKLRHRKLKLKKLTKGKKKKSNCKATIDDVKLKLKALEDEDDWMDIKE